MINKITKCRICGNKELAFILDLGNQYLTGVFPRQQDAEITCGPLRLVKCVEWTGGESCGLVQLEHSFDLDQMYGRSYGYRSGINTTMVCHLQSIVNEITERTPLNNGDIILDIGSNDGTLLRHYNNEHLRLLGIDPSAEKYRALYPQNAELVVDYFNSALFRGIYGNQKARVITSIAMFYDLESPLDFMKDIYDILDDQGIWVFEQSYMPLMLDETAYDTICHEHLEYYGLRQIKWMADRAGFKILDVKLNKINGGSFRVTLGKHGVESSEVACLMHNELESGLSLMKPYGLFRNRVLQHRDKLQNLVNKLIENKLIYGYGASTKGNVILQYCGFSSKQIPYIADRNPDKAGSFTPGTNIEIISEEKARNAHPDYFLVLPWHFRDEFLKRETEFLRSGGKFIFPLPAISVVGFSHSSSVRKRAIITGDTGQDGYYLSAFLGDLNYELLGIDCAGSIDLTNSENIKKIVNEFQPDEIYHLAAYHHSSEEKLPDDLTVFEKSLQVNAISTANFLESILLYSPSTKLFFANSCLIFGLPETYPQDETTCLNPVCLYGYSKYLSFKLCEFYRSKYGIFACNGILYNHESPRRKPDFISQKIVKGVVDISRGISEYIKLGNIDLAVDWSFAGDVVRAMHAILQLDQPLDFIVASGAAHTIREFLELAFSEVGLDWKNHIKTDLSLLTRTSSVVRIGNPSLLKKYTKWEPEVDFSSLVKMMVREEINRRKL